MNRAADADDSIPVTGHFLLQNIRGYVKFYHMRVEA